MRRRQHRERGATVVVLDRATSDTDSSEFVLADLSNAGQVPVAINEATRLMDAIDVLVTLEARQPSGRLVTAHEVALAIAYLAHPSSTSTNGTVLFVDGGMETLRIPPKM